MLAALPPAKNFAEAFPPQPFDAGQSVFFQANHGSYVQDFIGELVTSVQGGDKVAWVRLEVGRHVLVANTKNLLVLHEGPFLARSWPRPPHDITAIAAFQTLLRVRAERMGR